MIVPTYMYLCYMKKTHFPYLKPQYIYGKIIVYFINNDFLHDIAKQSTHNILL